jgi:hypothetical protein
MAPEQIRARLHERLEQATTAPTGGTAAEVPVSPTTRRRWLPRRRRRRAAPAG